MLSIPLLFYEIAKKGIRSINKEKEQRTFNVSFAE